MFTKKASFRVILGNLAWAILAAGVAIALVYAASAQISATTKSLTEKKRAAFILQKQSERLAALRNDLATIGGNDAKLASAFPPDDNISAFLAALQSLASQNSVQQSVQAGTPSVTSITRDSITLSRIDYVTTLNGTVVTLVNYLKGFEALPYFSAVRSLTINAPSGWEGNSTITISASLYAKQSNL